MPALPDRAEGKRRNELDRVRPPRRNEDRLLVWLTTSALKTWKDRKVWCAYKNVERFSPS